MTPIKPSEDLLKSLYPSRVFQKYTEKILMESLKKYPPMSDGLRVLSNDSVERMFSKTLKHLPDDEFRKIQERKTPLPFVEATFSPAEIDLILEFFLSPNSIDATWPKYMGKLTKKKRSWHEHWFKTNEEKAIRWAKMFADKPSAMIYALPKIKHRVEKSSWSQTAAVLLYYAQMNSFKEPENEQSGWKFAGEFCNRFWKAPAKVLAEELSRELKIKITADNIDDAREKIVKGDIPKISKEITGMK
jgi:hypothetical protein